MPAPLAKGLIISISIIFAAGLAVYENPQVRQWIDKSRRTVAIALHSLGDEILPSTTRSHRENQSTHNDASTREDESAEAVERRRRARNEILERGRMMEEKRRAQVGGGAAANSFANLVDEDGRLKETAVVSGTATAVEREDGVEWLRKRNVDGGDETPQHPFADDKATNLTAKAANVADRVRSTTPPTPPPKPFAYRSHSQSSSLDPPTAETTTSPLVDLTPPPLIPSSSARGDLSELSDDTSPNHPLHHNHNHDHHHLSNYYSVNEWADNSTTTASFYSPPPSDSGSDAGDGDGDGARTPQGLPSDAGTGEYVDRLELEGGNGSGNGSEVDYDFGSEVGGGFSGSGGEGGGEGGVVTPGSWTEVGSVVSEDDWRG